MAKPSPVSKVTVCSVCELPWDDHTKGRKTAPTADVCLRLLKAEVARLRQVPRQYISMSGSSNAAGGTVTNITPLHATG